jgi:subtilisin family serine protease
MSGTSMATPAVTGFTAYLLGANPDVVQAQGADRSQKLKDLLYASCNSTAEQATPPLSGALPPGSDPIRTSLMLRHRPDGGAASGGYGAV